MEDINETNNRNEEIEQLYKEFKRRLDLEREQRTNGLPIPVEIITELETLSPGQQQENFRKFKNDTQRYAFNEWTTPERINKSIYPELKKHSVETSQVINSIYNITETTRFQAKVAVEIYEQVQYVLHNQPEPEEIAAILERCAEQSRRLAVFGLVQAKNQEGEARKYAQEALKLPPSLKAVGSSEEAPNTKNAFSSEFLEKLYQARFEQSLLQKSAYAGRGRGNGQFNRGGFRGNFRGNRGRTKHFYGGYKGQSNNNSNNPNYNRDCLG